MQNMTAEICAKFKEARKAKGLNQTALAQAVGCKQSAVSMFEAGMATKLSDEAVGKMAELLGLDLAAILKEDEERRRERGGGNAAAAIAAGLPGFGDGQIVRGYCPNCQCPSNVPYVVDGRLLYRPSRAMASPGGGARCAQCGEVLEMRCPACGAPLNDGACCGVCGSAYVTPTLREGVDVAAYARARRAEILELKSFM